MEKKKIIINGIVCFEIGYSLVYIKMEYHTEKKKKSLPKSYSSKGI